MLSQSPGVVLTIPYQTAGVVVGQAAMNAKPSRCFGFISTRHRKSVLDDAFLMCESFHRTESERMVQAGRGFVNALHSASRCPVCS